MKKILIMGLPGSGKTTLASELVPLLKAKWINNDKVRREANDWDFSEAGRIRQAKRMANLADKYKEEGNYQSHCVGSYVDTYETDIISIRRED